MNILIAEDALLSRQMLERVLQEAGHRVVCVAEVPALLDACGRCDHETVLCDIHLGPARLDGVTACRKIVSDHPGVAVVMMTADPTDAQRAREFGFKEVLLKPFTLDQLYGALDRAKSSLRMPLSTVG